MLHRPTVALVQAHATSTNGCTSSSAVWNAVQSTAIQNKPCPITLSLGASCCALAAINLKLLSQYCACLHVAVAFAFGYGQYELHTPYIPNHVSIPINIAPKGHSAHHTPTGVLYIPSQTTSRPLDVESAHNGECHLSSTYVAIQAKPPSH
jgi:hypothetical protein